MADLTQEQIDNYTKVGGAICPSCHSNDIEGGNVDIDNWGAWQPVSCLSCGSTWTDIYKLTGVQNFEPGEL